MYPFNSRTMWHRLNFSLPHLTKCLESILIDNHKMPLKGGKKRADCLGPQD